MRRRTFAPALLIALLLADAGVALAQEHDAAADPAPSADEHGVRVSFDGRPALDVGSRFHLELGGRLNADVRADGADAGDTFDWSGRRLEMTGRVTRRVSFELSHELGADRPWRDVFVDVQAVHALAVRGGRFKVPFSDERLTGIGKLDFVNRSLAARVLAPGRDEGVMAFGEVGRKKAFTYEVGAFRGGLVEGGDEDVLVRQESSRPMAALRVTGRPLVASNSAPAWLRTLRIGGAVTRGWNVSRLSTLEASTFDGDAAIIEPVFVRGPRTGLGLEAQWSSGPVRVNAEWMNVHDARLGQALDSGDLPDLIGRGWYVSGVWQVAKRRGHDDGWFRESFFRELEIAGRVERLAVGTGVGPEDAVVHPRAEIIPWQSLRAYTIGAIWRLNKYGRIQVNAIAEQPDTTWPTGPAGNTRWSGVTRLQVQF